MREEFKFIHGDPMKTILIGLLSLNALNLAASENINIELSGSDEAIEKNISFEKSVQDYRTFKYTGACYVGQDVVRTSFGTFTKQKYKGCKQTKSVPTCKVEGAKLKTKVISYTTVCGSPLYSSVNVGGLSFSGYYYPKKCTKTARVSYCARKVNVERAVKIDVKNFTGATDQTLVLNKKGLTKLLPANKYFSIKKVTKKGEDLGLHARVENYKYEVAIMEPTTVADFGVSEIKEVDNSLEITYNQNLTDYKKYFLIKLDLYKKKLFGKKFKKIADQVYRLQNDENIFSVKISKDFPQRRQLKAVMNIGFNGSEYNLLSENVNINSVNERELLFKLND